MLRRPATKCEYHIAVCLLCCLAPSVLSPSNCAHVRATLTCYQNVLILPSCVNTSETANTCLTICTNLWIPIIPTQHSRFLGCDMLLGAWPPTTLWTTVCRSVTPGTTHPAIKSITSQTLQHEWFWFLFQRCLVQNSFESPTTMTRFCMVFLGPYTNTGMCISLQQMLITIPNHRKIQQM
jgi:hypothetical protein